MRRPYSSNKHEELLCFRNEVAREGERTTIGCKERKEVKPRVVQQFNREIFDFVTARGAWRGRGVAGLGSFC